MVTIHIFIEGGGGGSSSKQLAIAMRRAFKTLISRAGIPASQFIVVRCGSRTQAFKLFENAAKQTVGGIIPFLLVDSEEAVPAQTNPWTFLQQRDGWNRPANVRDDQVHLMTHCMETWFLADTEALNRYFSTGFNANALPKTQPIETALKEDILNGLNRATRESSKKKYDKGSHSFAILESLDPAKIEQQASWACRLFKTMDNVLVQKSSRVCREPILPKQEMPYP